MYPMETVLLGRSIINCTCTRRSVYTLTHFSITARRAINGNEKKFENYNNATVWVILSIELHVSLATGQFELGPLILGINLYSFQHSKVEVICAYKDVSGLFTCMNKMDDVQTPTDPKALKSAAERSFSLDAKYIFL